MVCSQGKWSTKEQWTVVPLHFLFVGHFECSPNFLDGWNLNSWIRRTEKHGIHLETNIGLENMGDLHNFIMINNKHVWKVHWKYRKTELLIFLGWKMKLCMLLLQRQDAGGSTCRSYLCSRCDILAKYFNMTKRWEAVSSRSFPQRTKLSNYCPSKLIAIGFLPKEYNSCRVFFLYSNIMVTNSW